MRVFFVQENVWPLCRAAKKIVAVITRWPYYRVGRKAGLHCKLSPALKNPAQVINRAFSPTWLELCKYFGTKERFYIRKKEDWSGKPKWPPFHCFGTPIWRTWRHVKTLYWRVQVSLKQEAIKCSKLYRRPCTISLPSSLLLREIDLPFHRDLCSNSTTTISPWTARFLCNKPEEFISSFVSNKARIKSKHWAILYSNRVSYQVPY